jgi:alkylhydroperoxidase family enzyme
LVQAVVSDLESSPLPEKEKVLFRFLDRVNADSHTITADEVSRVRDAGWSDEELYYAITVCALFNFYNRWIDATGVHALSDETHRTGAKRSAQHGYVRK